MSSPFRQSTLDRINSPEQLNDYIRVAKPGVWVVLAAVILLLGGMLVWATFGTLETTLPAVASVQAGEAVCYVSEAQASRISEGQPVCVGDQAGKVSGISATPIAMNDQIDEFIRHAGGFSEGDFGYVVSLDVEGLDDGVYDARITVERIHPMQFIIQ